MATEYMRIDADGVFVEVHADRAKSKDLRLLVGDGTEGAATVIRLSPCAAKIIALAILGATEDD